MLDVTRRQGDGLDEIDAAGGEADLFLQFPIGRLRGFLPRIDYPLGEAEFITVEPGRIFAG